MTSRLVQEADETIGVDARCEASIIQKLSLFYWFELLFYFQVRFTVSNEILS
jgi:hypothetical protein